MDETTPKPCPHCSSAPSIQRDPYDKTRVCMGCSNEINCPVWPVTEWHTTEAAAVAAWNAGLTQ